MILSTQTSQMGGFLSIKKKKKKKKHTNQIFSLYLAFQGNRPFQKKQTTAILSTIFLITGYVHTKKKKKKKKKNKYGE